MPALKDEMVLLADGFVSVDPASGLRQRAESFIASRKWSTPSVLYGDQLETDDSQTKPRWSMTFGLGLDHVPLRQSDWFADVAALTEFVQTIAAEGDTEFMLEFRLSSRLWYSETLGVLGGDADGKIDLADIRSMLEQFTKQKRSWWRRLIGQ